MSNWSCTSPADPQRAFERRDGARVEQEISRSGNVRWVAKLPGEYLRGKLFAHSEKKDGPVRTFKTADAAIKALDNEKPL
jgi:hypothetical protein